MFIHIGSDHVIRSRDIITIIDYDVITSSSIMEEMIETKEQKNKVKGPLHKAKSVVITTSKVYYSSLSIQTLTKRSSIRSMLQKFKDYSHNL